MPSIFNRNLVALLCLFGSISLANAQSGALQQGPRTGWTLVQDNPLVFCQGANRTGCTVTIGNLTPTVAGSVWVLHYQGPNSGVKIASVTGGGGTWVQCPNCYEDNTANGGYVSDIWYNLSGTAGTFQNITVTLAGNSGSFFGGDFIELLPPPGTTASFDDSNHAGSAACGTCTMASLNVTGTDAIIQAEAGDPTNWNAVSSPYINDANAFAICLNCTSGAAPTYSHSSGTRPATVSAIAFKSSAGTFTPPQKQFTLVNITPFGPASPCSSCVIPIPSTGSGNLLVVYSANEAFQHINSVNDGHGGSWVVPTGANTCQIQQNIMGQNNASSCAYLLSSAAGITQLTLSMSGSSAETFIVFEVSGAGSFVFDTQQSHFAASTGSNFFYANGEALTLSGNNDVVFQFAWDVGGSIGPNYYLQPHIHGSSTCGATVGPYNYMFCNEAAATVLTDTGPTAPTPVWINANPNNAMFFSALAFKTTGVSSAPNPPTGLTVVVQ